MRCEVLEKTAAASWASRLRGLEPAEDLTGPLEAHFDALAQLQPDAAALGEWHARPDPTAWSQISLKGSRNQIEMI